MKLCVDCRWHEPSKHSSTTENYDRCIKPVSVSPVTGKSATKHPHNYCTTMRTNYGKDTTCGPAAEWFEPREPAGKPAERDHLDLPDPLPDWRAGVAALNEGRG
jgi:hypothetical protein